jgi:hypothetical protein
VGRGTTLTIPGRVHVLNCTLPYHSVARVLDVKGTEYSRGLQVCSDAGMFGCAIENFLESPPETLACCLVAGSQGETSVWVGHIPKFKVPICRLALCRWQKKYQVRVKGVPGGFPCSDAGRFLEVCGWNIRCRTVQVLRRP